MKDGSALSQVRALILDMDGVLWRSEKPIGDLPAIFQRMKDLSLQVVLATNNSTKTADQYLDKLAGFGVNILERWQIVNSSQATAVYLREKFPQGGSIFIIGEDGLFEALQEEGFQHSQKDVLAVVVGMDRRLTFKQLEQAALLIRAGTPFIATNPDRTFPTPEGLIPGTGAILAALEAATEVKPEIVGKPNPGMYRVALSRLGCKPEETLVVGDRLETDIAGAQALGCPTALVLSGVTPEERARSWQPAPDWISPDLSTLINKFYE